MVDPGVLWLWRHDAAPDYPTGVDLPDDQVAELNDAVDLRLDGPDAVEVGERVGREWHPLYLYDVPRARVDEFRAEIESLAAGAELDASVGVLPERVTHRERVDQALEIGGGAGIVSFRHEAVAVGGLEPGAHVTVAREDDELVVEAAEGEAAARLEIGPVPVEEGRIAFLDVDAPEHAVAVEVGEGLYPVFRELDADGRLLRVRVALAQ